MNEDALAGLTLLTAIVVGVMLLGAVGVADFSLAIKLVLGAVVLLAVSTAVGTIFNRQ